MAVITVLLLSALSLLAVVLFPAAAALFFDHDELFNRTARTMLLHAIVLLIVTIEADLRTRWRAAGTNGGAGASGGAVPAPRRSMAVITVLFLSALSLLAIVLFPAAAALFFDRDELFNRTARTMLIHAIVLLIVTIDVGLRTRWRAAGTNSGAGASGGAGEYPQNMAGMDIVVCESKNVTIADGRIDHGTAESKPAPLPPPSSEAEVVKEIILVGDKEFDEFIAKMRRNIQQERQNDRAGTIMY